MLKMVVDTMGGDNGSKVVVTAIKNFLKKNNDVEIIAVGKKQELQELEGICEIIDAPDVVPMTAGALDVLRMKNSSMMIALNLIKQGRGDGIVSCGSTGGFLASSTIILKMIPGVKRAAIVTAFPLQKRHNYLTLLDCGANLENSSEELVQFAWMGRLYSQIVVGVSEPNVYLLSNGGEDEKGLSTIKVANKMLRESKFPNFVGNIEAREAILDPNVDVLVANGFDGNVFLKTMGEYPRRMAGIATHPNYTAEFCLVGTMLSFYLITTEKSRKWKTFSLLNIIISFFIIFIATSSRTSMVCMLFFTCAFLCFYFYSNRKDAKIVKRMKYILFCLLFIALICIILFFISDSFKKFVNEHVLRVSSLKTASGRDSVYKVAFELGKGHRIFGYNDKELANRIASHAHNMYLQLLSFSGIPGLVLYCIYFFYTIYLAIKNFFNNAFDSSEKLLNCLFLSYLICYILYGIPEDAGVNWMKAISVYAQIIFASIHILNYNVKLEEQRTSVDTTM